MLFFPEITIPFFPHPFNADEYGTVAFGGKLNTTTLLQAYAFGIFPWYNEGHPIRWCFTSPRCVLFPDNVKIQKSMRPLLNNPKFTFHINRNFEETIRLCKNIDRKDQYGTWITNDIEKAYIQLHKEGYAHSMEIYENDHLVGGLYGVALGKIFYGESMFSLVANASKLALIHLCKHLQALNFQLIDCQEATNHLLSMGATEIKKEDFWHRLSENRKTPFEKKSWKS